MGILPFWTFFPALCFLIYGYVSSQKTSLQALEKKDGLGNVKSVELLNSFDLLLF